MNTHKLILISRLNDRSFIDWFKGVPTIISYYVIFADNIDDYEDYRRVKINLKIVMSNKEIYNTLMNFSYDYYHQTDHTYMVIT